MSFLTLGLHDALLKAVAESGYESATEVQTQAVPAALAGADLMVSASTGSGKTAAFILPALQGILAERADPEVRREKGKIFGPRVLVLCPTRELAMQVAKAATLYGRHVQRLRVATVVGGVPYPAQIKALMSPLDILISTPGRLIDHIQSGRAILDNVKMLVLDEADRMLDMGFIEDIQMIADRVPATRQTVMFSATFGGHVGNLARTLLRDPQRIDVASHTDTHENIEQRLHWADNHHHKNALLDHILTQKDMEQAVVFTSTQRDADILADRLADMGHSAAALHGGMPQGRRNRVLQGLRNRQLRVLVATDVAARGIDVPTISHVINYGLPMKAEDYVHRIGRTGRAGRNGLAVTLAERMDVGMIRRIQQFTTQSIPVTAIEGLEPKSPQPRIHAGRPSGEFVGRAGGKPSFNNGPGRGGFGGHQKPFGMRRDEPGFGRDRNEGFAPRRDAAPREIHPNREAPFANRRDGAFVADRRPTFDGAPARKAFDRAPGHRAGGAPAFSPRSPGSSSAGVGRPAGKGGAFKSQRPRQGGFDR